MTPFLYEESITGGGADMDDICAIVASAAFLTFPFTILWGVSAGLAGFYAGFCIGD